MSGAMYKLDSSLQMETESDISSLLMGVTLLKGINIRKRVLRITAFDERPLVGESPLVEESRATLVVADAFDLAGDEWWYSAPLGRADPLKL